MKGIQQTCLPNEQVILWNLSFRVQSSYIFSQPTGYLGTKQLRLYSRANSRVLSLAPWMLQVAASAEDVLQQLLTSDTKVPSWILGRWQAPYLEARSASAARSNHRALMWCNTLWLAWVGNSLCAEVEKGEDDKKWIEMDGNGMAARPSMTQKPSSHVPFIIC